MDFLGALRKLLGSKSIPVGPAARPKSVPVPLLNMPMPDYSAHMPINYGSIPWQPDHAKPQQPFSKPSYQIPNAFPSNILRRG